MKATATWPADRMDEDEVEAFFAALAARIDPRPELRWETPLDLLVAVVLSAQTTDAAVNRVTETLWRTCRTPQDYLSLGQAALQERLRTIGLYRNKAASIIGLCHRILDDFGGEVPDSRDQLESLPGVGRKTANVVLNVVFRQPVMAVDTHVFRVANRTGLARGNTPLSVEKKLMKRVPDAYRLDAHHYLILHGRYTCKARKPECWRCPARTPCGCRRKVEEN